MTPMSARKGRRKDEALVTCGRMIDEFEELDATIDVIVWFLELGTESQYSILVGNSTVYKNSQSMSGCPEATGLSSSFCIVERDPLQRSKSFAALSFS